MTVTNPSVPRVQIQQTNGFFQRLDIFLDTYILPYPVKYLTNRLTILATMCLLIPLIVFANNQVFVLAANSYLNVMSVVVSSTVLLYSTISEARDREAAARREQIAREHEAAVEAREQIDHDLIEGIKAELSEHVTKSLENIQQILIQYLENLQNEDEARDIATQKAVLATAEAHNQQLETLRAMVKDIQKVRLTSVINYQSACNFWMQTRYILVMPCLNSALVAHFQIPFQRWSFPRRASGAGLCQQNSWAIPGGIRLPRERRILSNVVCTGR